MSQDPMDSPPRNDFGADRYDYIEIIGAPPGVQPHGEWFVRLCIEACPDCRANVFVYWVEDAEPPNIPWRYEIAHDETCPTLREMEA